MILKDKKILITGATGGIGYSLVKKFNELDANILASGTNELKLSNLSKEYPKINVVKFKLEEHNKVEAFIDQAFKKLGGLDILINNAGAIPAGNIEAIDEHTWREAWDLKVFGYINMTRRFYPLIKDNGGGVIMNVIGLAGVRVDRNYIAGSAGNASIIGFTNAMGAHALDEGMRVLGVCPGAVQTERITTMLKTRAKEEKGDENRWQDYFSGMPLNRPALVEEVADVVVFLCSDRASWLTGTTINLDGGVANRGGY